MLLSFFLSVNYKILEQTTKGDSDTISSSGDLIREQMKSQVRWSTGQSCLVILNVLDMCFKVTYSQRLIKIQVNHSLFLMVY